MASVGRASSDNRRASAWRGFGIPIGCALFIVALVGSAAVVPQLRLLHFFQALIYVAVIYLSRRNDAMGFGAGVAVAVVWNSLQLFITHNAQAGVRLVWSFVQTGLARRIDTMLVAVGTLGHFILIVACLAAFLEGGRERRWRRLFAGAAIGLAYFALIVATMRPR